MTKKIFMLVCVSVCVCVYVCVSFSVHLENQPASCDRSLVGWRITSKDNKLWMVSIKLMLSLSKSKIVIMLPDKLIPWSCIVCREEAIARQTRSNTGYMNLVRENFFSVRVPPIWNSLPDDIKKKVDNPVIQKPVRHLGQAEWSPSEQQSALNQTSSQPCLLNNVPPFNTSTWYWDNEAREEEAYLD